MSCLEVMYQSYGAHHYLPATSAVAAAAAYKAAYYHHHHQQQQQQVRDTLESERLTYFTELDKKNSTEHRLCHFLGKLN